MCAIEHGECHTSDSFGVFHHSRKSMLVGEKRRKERRRNRRGKRGKKEWGRGEGGRGGGTEEGKEEEKIYIR